jgi:hypothetical protein
MREWWLGAETSNGHADVIGAGTDQSPAPERDRFAPRPLALSACDGALRVRIAATDRLR